MGLSRLRVRGTQGVGLISPTLFNVVVYSVVRHWVTVIVESAEERSRHGQEGIHKDALLYVDDGMVTLSDP